MRRIPAHHFNADATCKIRQGQFEPQSGRDEDGLSFFREKLVSAQQLVNRALGKGPYYIARVKVQELLAIGLNPKITGDIDHVSLPELSVSSVEANRDASTKLMDTLAQLMSKQVVLGPAKPAKN